MEQNMATSRRRRFTPSPPAGIPSDFDARTNADTSPNREVLIFGITSPSGSHHRNRRIEKPITELLTIYPPAAD
jgi:hypothetical protein